MFKKGSRNRRLGVERLEDKHMLNGTVTALVAGGCLVLTGDAQDNGLSVAPPVGGAPGELHIQGDGTTLIRVGRGVPAGDVTVFGVTRSITVNLLRGDDNIAIGGVEDVDTPMVLKGSVIVVDVLGNNSIAVSNATLGGSVAIATGSGADNVALGTSAFIADPLVSGPLAAKLGVTVNTGSGDNFVDVVDVTTPIFTLVTGSGLDEIAITTLVTKYATISTGSSIDVLTIDDSTIAKDFVLAMGLGDDILNVGLATPNTVGRFAILNGGPGHDTLNGVGVNNIDPAKTFVISFEEIT
jgi:hypothetical protein